MRGYYSPLATSDRLRVVVLVAFFILTPVFAGAIEFDLLSGRVTGHFDTTLSMGLAWRVSDRDPNIVGASNGGTGQSLNGDDGNLNYDRGDIFSTNLKVLHEISFDYDEYAVFVRGFYFRDFAVTEGDVAPQVPTLRIETVWIFEDARVAVGCADQSRHDHGPRGV